MFYNVVYKLLGANYSILNILRYVTFRSICAFFTSLFIVLIIGPRAIRFLRTFQLNGQPIRDDGPASHIESKKGTPTMGGTMIILSVCLSSLLFADLSNAFVLTALGIMLGFGAIGALDDYHKVKKHDYHGMTGKKKFLLQVAVASCCYCIAHMYDSFDVAFSVFFPIIKNVHIDLGWGFVAWAVFVIVGSSNAVNLTDGLDGLAVGPVTMTAICFAIISYLVGSSVFAEYLKIPCVIGVSELCVFLGALVGASLGFMWFNAPPAKVFMGDTGSIAIGGSLGYVAIMTKQELILPIVGGIFVLEAISVILQVSYFKLTRKRIFLMAPIHHHFERLGWSEPTVVFRFWIISIALGVAALATLKVR
jgi:phospho-N-acetylmuramoyl-pentapeptide-transferase